MVELIAGSNLQIASVDDRSHGIWNDAILRPIPAAYDVTRARRREPSLQIRLTISVSNDLLTTFARAVRVATTQ